MSAAEALKATITNPLIIQGTRGPGSSPDHIVVPDLDAPVDRLIHIINNFSATMSNPQGDVDTGNQARIDIVSGRGVVTPQGLKRKVRDIVATLFGMPIHVARRAVLVDQVLAAAVEKGLPSHVLQALGEEDLEDEEDDEDNKKKKKAKKPSVKLTEEEANAVMQAVFDVHWDIKAFGKVFTKPIIQGSTGPVQFTYAMSVDPIEIIDNAVTLCAVTNRESKERKDTDLGRASVVRFGLYETSITVNPMNAIKTGFSWRDLDLLLHVVQHMWTLTKSTNRADMQFERMCIFELPSITGIQERTLKKVCGIDYKGKMVPDDQSGSEERLIRCPLSMDDYVFTVDRSKLPTGVKLIIV